MEDVWKTFWTKQGIFIVTALLDYGATTSAPSVWHKVGLILIVILAAGAGIGAVQLLPSYDYGKLSPGAASPARRYHFSLSRGAS